MITLKRTNSDNPHFVELVKLLDAYLTTVDGDEHAFYDQFNGIENLRYVVVAYDEDHPVGCGAIKEFRSDSMEVKRMFVDPAFRGNGIAKSVLSRLETWAAELGYQKCVLETGKRQIEAVALYRRCGYQSIPNYEPYTAMENSVCFEKLIR